MPISEQWGPPSISLSGAGASLLCFVRPDFGGSANSNPLPDLFRHLKVDDPFLVCLRWHGFRRPDQLARSNTRNLHPHHLLLKENIGLLSSRFWAPRSAHLLFWQAGEEVEQMESAPNEKPLKKAPQEAAEQLQRIKIDTYAGMALSNLSVPPTSLY